MTLAFFFPLLRGNTFSDVDHRQQQIYPWAGAGKDGSGLRVVHYDYDESFYPWQVFMNRELRQGEFPLWNPYSFGGVPFFANGQSGVLYPPRLALSLTLSPTRVHDLLLASHLFVAGLAMFLLLGFVGVAFPAALVGGLAWMLNSFALSWQVLEHYVAIGAWLPIGVLLAHAAVRRRSWPAAFALALVLGLLFLGGNVLFVELAVVAILGYGIALALADARRDRRSLGGAAGRIGTAMLLFAGLTAVSTLPVLDVAEASARVSLSYDEIGQFALPWKDLVNVIRQPPVWSGDPYHVNLFAGTAVGLLALVGLWRRESLARFATVLGALTILFMVHTPVTFAVDQLLPGFGNFKPLARAAFLLQFALAVLAAFGLEAVLRWLATPAGARLTQSRFLAGGLAGAVVGASIVHLGRSRLGGSTALVLALVSGVVVAVALERAASRKHELDEMWRRVWSRLSTPTPAASAVFVAVVAVSIVGQAGAVARHVMPDQPDEPRYLFPRTPLIRYLEERPGARFLPTGPSFRGSTAMIYPLQSAGGYESLLPQRIQDFWRVVGEGMRPEDLADSPLIYAYHPQFELSELQPEVVARASVEYVVTPPQPNQSGGLSPDLQLVYTGSDGRVFRVRNPMPRAYLVTGCRRVATPLEALRIFVSPAFDPRQSVVLEASQISSTEACPGARSGTAGTAAVVSRSINALDIAVEATSPAWLVVAESWDKGWTARLDGRPVEVLPGNYAMRATRVPAGSHRVSFTYRPERFGTGALVSAAALTVSLLGLIATWLVSRRRRRVKPG